MRISVRITPGSKRNEVVAEGDNRYRVYVTAPPVEGRANEKLIELLAGYFHKPRRAIQIIRGRLGREKIIDIT